MSLSDKLDYINPIYLWNAVKTIAYPDQVKPKIPVPKPIVDNVKVMARAAGPLFIRLAGLSGATAVAMGAYGTHAFYPRQDVPSELKEVYKTANYYHFVHTLALLAVPLTKRPRLVGTLLTTGMAMFCGTCYFYALTGHKQIVKITPYGGMLLIIAWLSMML